LIKIEFCLHIIAVVNFIVTTVRKMSNMFADCTNMHDLCDAYSKKKAQIQEERKKCDKDADERAAQLIKSPGPSYSWQPILEGEEGYVEGELMQRYTKLS